MAKSYKCKDGDRIDLIVLDEYGNLEMLTEVLAVNVHALSKIPLMLQSGITLSLPVAPVRKIASKKVKGALW